MEDRKQKEAHFHNERERLKKEDPEAYKQITKNKKFYSITRKSRNYVDDWLKEKSPGSRLLDYCCGTGGVSTKAALYGAEVVGIDISNESIETCKTKSADLQLQDKTSFFVMDAENLSFEDNSFDLIVCSGVLHHLDVKKAFPELSRVLRPGGEIICIEALGYNPIINWYRRRTPHMRTEWEADHILTLNEVDLARNYFNNVKIEFFHLLSLAGVPFRNLPVFNSILSLLEWLDSLILAIPGIQKQAWQMIFILSSPKKKVLEKSEMLVRGE